MAGHASDRERGRGILAWVSGRETVREREREGLDDEQSRVRSPQFMNHSGSIGALRPKNICVNFIVEDASSRVFCFIPFLSSKKLIAASQTLSVSHRHTRRRNRSKAWVSKGGVLYNFVLFPSDVLKMGMPTYSFSVQTSHLTSMAEEGFDFNACIYNGKPPLGGSTLGQSWSVDHMDTGKLARESTQIVSHILVKALKAMLSPDFSLCLCLIPERVGFGKLSLVAALAAQSAGSVV
ncbi:hypothetical protein C1H46_016759 [Malus baccata]|uniref:Uncharacterized protein n=1 Tax=Malus baccata TaxID=106549 RepID=A0A540MGE8_MALBA|nr:hypothetical protein C1H46_016759 [Malus baccata]